jgi:hypothetical protein
LIRSAVAVAALTLPLLAACSDEPPEDPTAFCVALAEVSAPTGPVTSLDLDDAEVVRGAVAGLDELRRLAPVEVDDEMDAVASVYAEVIEVLAGTAPRARADVLRDYQADLDEVADAAARLQGWAESTCGVTLSPPEPTESVEPSPPAG